MIEFLWPAFVAGIAVALVAGPIGCQLSWRRMAFFGDTLSHGALLGIALGALLSVDLSLAVVVVASLMAAGLFVLQRRDDVGTDTLLGVLAHAALAFGMIGVALVKGAKPNLTALLFGDILFVLPADAWRIAAAAAVILLLVLRWWRPMTSATVQEELARIEGVDTDRVKLLLALLLACTVAIAMKIVGLLLITALLVVPAAAARRFAREPERMAVLASAIGVFAVIAGLLASWHLDLPAGPAIVAAASLVFLATRFRAA